MSQLLDNAVLNAPVFDESDFPRKQWTFKECQRLTAKGLLINGRYELIEGDVVSKMGQGDFHIYVVARLIELLTTIFGFGFVQSQAGIGIGEILETSDPEPDIAVLAQPIRDFFTQARNPRQDVRLVVEVADTTLRGDMNTKVRIYAQVGISEYWVVDIRGRRLIVFRGPDGENYRERVIYGETETVAPLAAPQAGLLVADMLP